MWCFRIRTSDRFLLQFVFGDARCVSIYERTMPGISPWLSHQGTLIVPFSLGKIGLASIHSADGWRDGLGYPFILLYDIDVSSMRSRFGVTGDMLFEATHRNMTTN